MGMPQPTSPNLKNLWVGGLTYESAKCIAFRLISLIDIENDDPWFPVVEDKSCKLNAIVLTNKSIILIVHTGDGVPA